MAIDPYRPRAQTRHATQLKLDAETSFPGYLRIASFATSPETEEVVPGRRTLLRRDRIDLRDDFIAVGS